MAKQTVAAAMADMFESYGVTHVFYMPAVLRRMLMELERRTAIERVHAHTEAGAVYMADGYARAAGRPGVCMAQIVGALNLCAGIRDAHLAKVPLIALTGGREADHRDRWAYQEVDDLPAFAPYTKMNVAVDDPNRLPDMLRQAFRMATTGSPGPVHLQLAGNTGQAIENAEIDFDGITEPRYGQVPPDRPQPDSDRLRAAADRIAAAERPVIVAGGGVKASGASEALVRFAESMQIPVATSLNAKDAITESNPLSVGVVGTYSRRSANQVVANADLVIFIGTRAGGMTTHFWTIPAAGTPAVQIDIDPGVTGRNYPTDVSVIGDAKVTLERMAELNTPVPEGRATWIAEVEKIRRSYQDDFAELYRSDATPIRPRAHRARALRGDAGGRPGGRRYRPFRHVDGRHVRAAPSAPELYPQRRPPRLGLPGGNRRQMRCPGPPGGLFHRRPWLLVPHERGRDGGARRHQHDHRDQQQPLRQPGIGRHEPAL